MFENPSDYKLFRQKVIVEQKLRVNILCLEKTLEEFQAEVAKKNLNEKFQALQFDGVLLDLVKADPKILAVLCNDPGLDRMVKLKINPAFLCKRYT